MVIERARACLPRGNMYVVGLAFACLMFAQTSAQPGKSDGRLWTRSSEGWRLGFVDGFGDCYTNDRGRGARLSRPRLWYASAITDHYRNRPESLEDEVGSVLAGLSKGRRGAKASPADSMRTVFDGMMWLNYSHDERVGFVAGWLSCRLAPAARESEFPRSDEQYADEISAAYGVADVEHGRADALDSRADRRIAARLWQWRNRK